MTMARKISNQFLENFSVLMKNMSTDSVPKKMSKSESKNEFRSLTLVAACPDKDDFEAAVFEVTDSMGFVNVEERTYFNVMRGELKLRVTRSNQKYYGELVAVRKSETKQPGIYFNEGSATYVQDVTLLENTLKLALSELGIMTLRRRTFVKDNIQINLDEIENVGLYVNLNLSLASDTPTDAELAHIVAIQKELRIADVNVVPHSYLELFRKIKSSDSGLDDESNQSDG